MDKLPEKVILDLAVRFVLNLPEEDRDSWERILPHCQEAYYYYVDVLRPRSPELPEHVNFGQFTRQLLGMFTNATDSDISVGLDVFKSYYNNVQVCGVVMFDSTRKNVLLVCAREGSRWVFPKGKLGVNETAFDCAVREVWEEVGVDVTAYMQPEPLVQRPPLARDPPMCFFAALGPWDASSTQSFKPLCVGEIHDIRWVPLAEIQTEYQRTLRQQDPGLGFRDQSANALTWVSSFYPDFSRVK